MLGWAAYYRIPCFVENFQNVEDGIATIGPEGREYAKLHTVATNKYRHHMPYSLY